MIYTLKTRRVLFLVIAGIFILAVIYHIVAAFYSIDESPVWRHLLFIAINLFCVYGVLKRPRYFLYFFVLFIVQQYYSHGSYLVMLWQQKNKIHWISIFDLLLLPLILMCLVKEYRIKYHVIKTPRR